MKFRLIVACVAGLILTACSSSPDEYSNERITDVEVGYERAKRSIYGGNYVGARQTLEELNTRFPFGALTHQIQLDLIYVYYKTGDIDKALAAIDRFTRLNPNHPAIDYVLYMRGLTNERVSENLFQDLLGVNRADRDPSKAREAFDDYAELVMRFPDSKYAADARQRMIGIKSRLARHELAVADYYMKREAYLAAANRGKYILENFADTPEVEHALAVMAQAYEVLGLTELKDDALATLAHNFPQSRYLEK
ncbi:Beta-barrel assembly machine subunit BamD [Pseudidiomarina indica]|uniref:Outer membrane protein assembly factor BamD n=1 Tax=Pseudidiomarina indica TaxID=1159017 RepID=A0A1G6CYT1_9GAMM|nr:outer membrane protein assembly factor BamD [Pseudidiomarina indica]SDB38084.1 Beta-barrel assembly machine subunit BamD [Pseudidiomarina indica]